MGTGSQYGSVNSNSLYNQVWAWKAGNPSATNSGGQNPTSGSVMIDGVASTAHSHHLRFIQLKCL